jgi:hypothetical protein
VDSTHLVAFSQNDPCAHSTPVQALPSGTRAVQTLFNEQYASGTHSVVLVLAAVQVEPMGFAVEQMPFTHVLFFALSQRRSTAMCPYESQAPPGSTLISS